VKYRRKSIDRAIENSVLRKIFEPKREDVTGGWRPGRIDGRIILKCILK
jgi:hypothetical protein